MRGKRRSAASDMVVTSCMVMGNPGEHYNGCAVTRLRGEGGPAQPRNCETAQPSTASNTPMKQLSKKHPLAIRWFHWMARGCFLESCFKKHPLAIRWFHWLNFPLLGLMI